MARGETAHDQARACRGRGSCDAGFCNPPRSSRPVGEYHAYATSVDAGDEIGGCLNAAPAVGERNWLDAEPRHGFTCEATVQARRDESRPSPVVTLPQSRKKQTFEQSAVPDGEYHPWHLRHLVDQGWIGAVHPPGPNQRSQRQDEDG